MLYNDPGESRRSPPPLDCFAVLAMTWRCRRHTPVSFPRKRESSTLRLHGSIIDASGVLDPRLRGDDTGRGMTVECVSAISRHPCPRFASSLALIEYEGAGKTGCVPHP